MSHALGGILGDIGGAGLGAILGSIIPGVGTAIGAGIGGALGGGIGEAASGGNLTQDLISAAGGGLGGYGVASAAGSLLGGAADAAAGAGTSVAAGVTDLGAGVADSAAGNATAGLATLATPAGGVAGDAASAASALGTTPLQVAGPGVGAVTPVGADSSDLFLGATTTQDATAGAGAAAGGAAPTAGSGVAGAVGGNDPLFPDVSGGNLSAALGQPSSNGILSSVGNYISDHPLQSAGAAVSALGLGKSLLTANQTNPIAGMSSVQGIAQQEQAQGATLENYINTGTLPPAVQAAVSAATQDGITAIKSKYAGMGVAPGSSAETADIARLRQDAVVQGATLADQLLGQGLSQTNLAAGLYNDLVGYNVTLNNQTNTAISNLATSLAGGGVKVTGAANNNNGTNTGGLSVSVS